MAQFRRFLLVTDRDARIAQADCEVDIVSWDSLKSIGNPADYDGWILNTTALRTRAVRKIFTPEELKVLFDYRALLAVMEGAGRIFIIGDFKRAFYTPESTGTGPKAASPAREQPFNLFEKILNVERDPRPVDYRRISRPQDYRYEDIYAYLDQVAVWDYSLKFQKSELDITRVELGTTNFGTCLAAHVSISPGGLVLLPSLGRTVEEEDRYVLKHFFGIGMQAAPPGWANKLAVPEQKRIEKSLSEKRQSLEALFAEIKAQAKELTNVQRWKRLLYDDGVGLEEIVKESFELLGAQVVKKTPEKDDYRLEVAGRGPCVLEVKGTRKDQFLRRDLRQLSEWIDQVTSEELASVKSAFVGNASREKEPSSRGSMFDVNNIEYAKLKQMVSRSSCI